MQQQRLLLPLPLGMQAEAVLRSLCCALQQLLRSLLQIQQRQLLLHQLL